MRSTDWESWKKGDDARHSTWFVCVAALSLLWILLTIVWVADRMLIDGAFQECVRQIENVDRCRKLVPQVE